MFYLFLKIYTKKNLLKYVYRKKNSDEEEKKNQSISVVNKPAIDSNFQLFADTKVQNFVAKEEADKHMLYGCALRADYPIYRRDEDGYEYLLEFDADAIRAISQRFMKDGFQKKWTADHNNEINGLTVTESWLKTDEVNDKSVALGLKDVPVNSWCIGVFCENEDIWEACKAGTYKGFSIESLISMEEFESMVEKENEKMLFEEETMGNFLNEIRTMISDALATKSTEPVEQTELTEQTEQIEEKPVETPSEKPKPIEVTNPTPEENNEPTEPVNEPQVEKDNHLEELVKNLQAEIEALKGQNVKLQDKVKELSKEPSAKPITTTSGANKGDSYADWREKMRKLIN